MNEQCMKIKIKKTNSLNNQMVLRLLVCVSLSVWSSRVGVFSLQHIDSSISVACVSNACVCLFACAETWCYWHWLIVLHNSNQSHTCSTQETTSQRWDVFSLSASSVEGPWRMFPVYQRDRSPMLNQLMDAIWLFVPLYHLFLGGK